MKKLILVTVFLVFVASLIFANATTSVATLTIEGYKLSEAPEEGTLRVYVYDTSSSDSTTIVADKVDITNYLSNYISGFKDVFSVKIQTNLNKKITVSISVSPFISQDTTKSVIKTSYYLTKDEGSYTASSTTSDYYGTYTTYYKYTASMNVSDSSFTNSSSGKTVGNSASTDSATVQITQTISAKSGFRSDIINRSYSLKNETLDYIEKNTVDSMIYMQMKLNTTTDKITANVEYKAPVTITVSIQ